MPALDRKQKFAAPGSGVQGEFTRLAKSGTAHRMQRWSRLQTEFALLIVLQVAAITGGVVYLAG